MVTKKHLASTVTFIFRYLNKLSTFLIHNKNTQMITIKLN